MSHKICRISGFNKGYGSTVPYRSGFILAVRLIRLVTAMVTNFSGKWYSKLPMCAWSALFGSVAAAFHFFECTVLLASLCLQRDAILKTFTNPAFKHFFGLLITGKLREITFYSKPLTRWLE